MKSLIRFRNFLYDSGLADCLRLKTPVISVGNLSMGGTGKTPVVEEILSRAFLRNLQATVVSRNYKAESRGPEKVNISKAGAAAYFGDEAFSLAQNFPQVPVYTGPKKYLTAQLVEKRESFDILVVDDGFQHRALFRDFDLVLIDASRPLTENQLFPRGKLREDFSSLQRASLVALTKVNWAEPGQVEKLKHQIREAVPGREIEICEIEFQQSLSVPIANGTKVISVAGIANPEIFEKNLLREGLEVVKSFRFADHFAYSSSDADRLLREMTGAGAVQIVTTQKDFVKLCEFSNLQEVLNPMKLNLNFLNEPKGLDAFLDSCARK